METCWDDEKGMLFLNEVLWRLFMGGLACFYSLLNSDFGEFSLLDKKNSPLLSSK